MERRKTGLQKRRTRQLLFYIALIAVPIVQFIIYYLIVNINTVLLAFQSYNGENGEFRWTGFGNISMAWANFFRTDTSSYLDRGLLLSFRNSFIAYAAGLIVGTTLALLFSYVIIKKMRFAEFFKLTLFLPFILSAIVMVVCFKYFANRALPEIMQRITGEWKLGLTDNENTIFATILVYSLWTGFGASVLMYTGAMGNISPAVIEAAKMDGITPFKEFIHITIPMIWPTLTTFIVVGVAGIFNNQLNAYSFFGANKAAQYTTIGYYLYSAVKTANSQLDYSAYSYISAVGFLLTIIIVPITLAVKKLLERFGPSED